MASNQEPSYAQRPDSNAMANESDKSRQEATLCGQCGQRQHSRELYDENINSILDRSMPFMQDNKSSNAYTYALVTFQTPTAVSVAKFDNCSTKDISAFRRKSDESAQRDSRHCEQFIDDFVESRFSRGQSENTRTEMTVILTKVPCRNFEGYASGKVRDCFRFFLDWKRYFKSITLIVLQKPIVKNNGNNFQDVIKPKNDLETMRLLNLPEQEITAHFYDDESGAQLLNTMIQIRGHNMAIPLQQLAHDEAAKNKGIEELLAGLHLD